MNKDVLADALGWGIIIVGIVGSCLAGYTFKALSISKHGDIDYNYNWPLMIGGIISSVLFGLIFILIGEILYTEYDNRKRISHLSEKNDEIIRSTDAFNSSISEKFNEIESMQNIPLDGNVGSSVLDMMRLTK
jgi:uncharacterized membrane protein YeaQ/YmgE (transglycosylase-associated protein family)